MPSLGERLGDEPRWPRAPRRARIRSATSTTVTATPNREKAWASSHADRATADHDQRRRAARSPGRRRGWSSTACPRGRRSAGPPASVPVLRTTPRAADVRRPVDLDPARPGEPAVRRGRTSPPAFSEPLDRDRVVPVVGGLVADPVGDGDQSGRTWTVPARSGTRRASASQCRPRGSSSWTGRSRSRDTRRRPADARPPPPRDRPPPASVATCSPPGPSPTTTTSTSMTPCNQCRRDSATARIEKQVTR